MGLFDKMIDKINPPSIGSSSSQTTAQFPLSPAAPPLGPDSVVRYRKQRGVNLGAWFVQERWISDKPYRNAVKPGQSDFDIAKGGDGKRIMEEHWDTWIKDEDWGWIKEHGYNAVRLPVSSTLGMEFESGGRGLMGDWVLSSVCGRTGRIERYGFCPIS